jgi:hypothetical protein
MVFHISYSGSTDKINVRLSLVENHVNRRDSRGGSAAKQLTHSLFEGEQNLAAYSYRLRGFDKQPGRRSDEPPTRRHGGREGTRVLSGPIGGAPKWSRMNTPVTSQQRRRSFCVHPDQLVLALRRSCDRAEFMLAFVMRLAPVSILAGTCSPLEAASAVLMPS